MSSDSVNKAAGKKPAGAKKQRKKIAAQLGSKGWNWSSQVVDERSRGRKASRNEMLVILAIVILFIANVVLYLCHHWGLTSANKMRARPGMATLVIVD